MTDTITVFWRHPNQDLNEYGDGGYTKHALQIERAISKNEPLSKDRPIFATAAAIARDGGWVDPLTFVPAHRILMVTVALGEV